jgi:hypothetical protein
MDEKRFSRLRDLARAANFVAETLREADDLQRASEYPGDDWDRSGEITVEYRNIRISIPASVALESKCRVLGNAEDRLRRLLIEELGG